MIERNGAELCFGGIVAAATIVYRRCFVSEVRFAGVLTGWISTRTPRLLAQADVGTDKESQYQQDVANLSQIALRVRNEDNATA